MVLRVQAQGLNAFCGRQVAGRGEAHDGTGDLRAVDHPARGHITQAHVTQPHVTQAHAMARGDGLQGLQQFLKQVPAAKILDDQFVLGV